MTYPLGVGFLLFSGLGLYLISKGVDADFYLPQIGIGCAALLLGLAMLMAGIIYGDLVPSWLAVFAPAAFSGAAV